MIEAMARAVENADVHTGMHHAGIPGEQELPNR